ncbi:hypothetical protein [Qaidamihabitans albus]|uniref:hypothetical protein n=1 Tax=Qaidamihabitans albus TaxID=2795733 RepID=UPI0018F17CD9|nr:hypothetical protein [Qaidamihabitans albus]
MVTEWVWAGVPIEVYYRHEELRKAGRSGRKARARRLRRLLARHIELPRQRTDEPEVAPLRRAA